MSQMHICFPCNLQIHGLKAFFPVFIPDGFPVAIGLIFNKIIFRLNRYFTVCGAIITYFNFWSIDLFRKKAVELTDLKNRAGAAVMAAVNKCRMQLTAQMNRLSALNPKSVLQRGYTITTNKKTGLLVKSSEDVRIGDYVITELAEEKLIESKVTKKYK